MSDTVRTEVRPLGNPDYRVDITDAPTNGKPSRPDPDAYRTELQARLADAEKELTKDQRSLEAARAKVADLEEDVKFDGWKVGSRTKEIAEYDRLRAQGGEVSTDGRVHVGDICPYCGEPMTRLVKLSDGWVHADCLPTPPAAPTATQTAMGGEQR